MKISELTKGLDIIDIKGHDIDIKGIAYDSRKVRPGFLFVCIKGYKFDGHDFVRSALENGAAALIVQDDMELGESSGGAALEQTMGLTVVKVADSRYALASVSDKFFDHPSAKLRLIGVTGTKGKTTTTYMIKSIFEAASQKVGLIGTITNMIGDEIIYTERTTPESYDLQALFSEMHEKGVHMTAMEVSSQGLKLSRVACCEFDIAIFTNFSRDHIGPNEHPDFQDYFESKKKLFSMCKRALVNIDDDNGVKIAEGTKVDVFTFSLKDFKADIFAKNIVKHSDSVEFDVVSKWGECHIKTGIPGLFSVYNSLAAIGAALISGISFEVIKAGLEKISVPGRAEVVETGRDFTVMIDYAHSPDSLKNILSTVKGFAKGRLICLFGCGGDRDKAKRPQMAKISGEIADYTIITSDNPRTEKPECIVADIETGISGTGAEFVTIVDRTEAIKHALETAKAGDVIVLAGKGHETYQTFKDKTIHYDEREIVADLLGSMEDDGCSR